VAFANLSLHPFDEWFGRLKYYEPILGDVAALFFFSLSLSLSLSLFLSLSLYIYIYIYIWYFKILKRLMGIG
jgi:hypothetical protein